MPDNRPNYYSILGVEDYASADTIRNAYRSLAKKFHPDTCQISDKRQAEEQFTLINEAYDVLSDPDMKKDFDEYLFNKQINMINQSKVRTINSTIYPSNHRTASNSTVNNYTPKSYSTSSNTDNSGYNSSSSNTGRTSYGNLSFDEVSHYYSELKSKFDYKADSNLADRVSIIVKIAAAVLFLVIIIFIGLTFDNKSKDISQEQSNTAAAAENKKPEQEDPLKNFVTIGKSKQQVKAILGKPSGVGENVWKYGSSMIFFDTINQVKGWDNTGRNLKVFVYKKEDGAPPIRLGSTKLDVKKAMGTPSFLNLNLWKYGSSEIYFNEDGKVKKIVNRDGNLKVQF